MNSNAIASFRRKLAADQPVYGLWVTLESPTITEMAVALGLDWVVIGAEHGLLGWTEIAAHIRATVRSRTVTLVEIPERNTAYIKRTLDLGADGVVIPWVETPEQLEEAIRDCHYPPRGRRGVGGERATVWGDGFVEHTTQANKNVLVLPKIESVATVQNLKALCRVPEVEVFMFGPADFSATAGHLGQWEGPGVAEQILSIKDTLRAHGKHGGIIAGSAANLVQRREQGFRVLAVGIDTGLVLRGLHERLASVGCDRTVTTSLDPADGRPLAWQ